MLMWESNLCLLLSKSIILKVWSKLKIGLGRMLEVKKQGRRNLGTLYINLNLEVEAKVIF